MNEVRPQLQELLFSSLENVMVESVMVTDVVVRAEALSITRQATCPDCGCPSVRIHGSYLRFPHDLPTAGRTVVVALRVRRFGRRTERLRSTLVSVGLALTGRAGARITYAFGAPVSRNTLLRLIASLPDPPTVTPRVVGVG